MFVLTAKLNKRKIIAALLAIAVLAALLVIYVTRDPDETVSASLSAVVKDNEQRVQYLNSLGWEVSADPIEQQVIVIPKKLSGTYAEYNELQLSQGFDLKDFGGLEAMRYTYSVLNHPSGENTIVADIIIYRNQIIAGDIQSTALDGFMNGLEFPK